MAFTICWHSGYVFHVALRIGEVNLFWDSLYFLIQKCPSFVPKIRNYHPIHD